MLDEVRTEYAGYFDALAEHPRSLVGREVPKADGSGKETLRDSTDAREWQEQIKLALAAEVKDRVSRRTDEVKPMLNTLHSSVKLFQDNHDLIPGTKQFDFDLASQFTTFAKPYELRVDGKLTGYTIPVQGIIDTLRSQLTTSRAAAAATAGAVGSQTAPAGGGVAPPTAQQQRAAEQPRTPAGQFHNPDAPQVGLESKAGNAAGEPEDFSTLFGTIGMPNFRF